MPQASSDTPPRPEFTPFAVPLLCVSSSYDGKDFWTYPRRCGWIVNVKDTQCHDLCPPGACYDGMEIRQIWEIQSNSRVPRPPMFARSDGQSVVASEKVAFLQSWLFFGALTEVSNLCGLEINIAAEFIADGETVSTANLNGLPGRWFEALVRTHRAGDKAVMELILNIARHSFLLLSEELGHDNVRVFEYTYCEGRALHALDILVRIIGLHLLLHIYMPGFLATEEEGWGRDRISKCLDRGNAYSEGMDQLSALARADLESQGWCESELDLLTPEDLAFSSLLPRPRIRDHSGCGDIICKAYQTDESTYETRHVEDGCTCDFIGAKITALVAALIENKVPKLIITEDLQFRVISESDYPYVALSHVCTSSFLRKSLYIPKLLQTRG